MKSLRAAIDRLVLGRGRVAKGWLQCQHYEKRGGTELHCADHAIYSVESGYFVYKPDDVYPMAALWLEKAQPGYQHYNDARGRTQGEVVAMFDRAIALARASAAEAYEKAVLDALLAAAQEHKAVVRSKFARVCELAD